MTGITFLGALGLIGCLGAGLIVGFTYFTAMWRSAELFAAGGRTPLALVLVAGRFALIVTFLLLIATRGGALPLLAAAIGIFIARITAVRRVQAMAV